MKHNITVILSILLCIFIMLSLMGCGAGSTHGWEPGSENKFKTIQTAYLVLEFPAAYAENLKHEELVGTDRTEEVFYMVNEGVDTELFRVCFGDQTAGTLVGYLHTESGVVPVTVQISGSPENMDEATENLYFGMMEGMNDVLDCVYRDERFSEYSDFHRGESTSAAMKYWTVDLPESITWEEVFEGDLYQVSFYGEVASTRIKLYSITIGDEEAENPLGTMEIDGKAKTVSVKVEGLSQASMMSEEDQNIVYSMMDTINVVIQQVVSSEQFTPINVE